MQNSLACTFADRNNEVDDAHLWFCLEAGPLKGGSTDCSEDIELSHIRLGELFRYTSLAV